MLSDTTHRLYISVDGQQKEITHLNADQTRVLVGVSINLQNKNNQIISLFNEKIKCYVDKLKNKNVYLLMCSLRTAFYLGILTLTATYSFRYKIS